MLVAITDLLVVLFLFCFLSTKFLVKFDEQKLTIEFENKVLLALQHFVCMLILYRNRIISHQLPRKYN